MELFIGVSLLFDISTYHPLTPVFAYRALTGILGCTWVQRNYREELAETEGVRDIEGCLQGRNAAPIPTARITKTHRKVFI